MPIDKNALRASAKALRSELARTRPGAAQELADRFPEKLFSRFGPCVAGYISIGSEIDPAPLLKKLKAIGADICFPRVETDNQMSFRRVSGPEDLETGLFGLTQPCADTEEAIPTFVLAPLLAFDASGNRLGYGKGHYDRALARLRQSGRVFVCGMAYGDQEVLNIPADATDIPLDWVLTPERSLPLLFSRLKG